MSFSFLELLKFFLVTPDERLPGKITIAWIALVELIGIITALLYISESIYFIFSNSGIVCMTIFANSSVGFLLGFLFGIPRSTQSDQNKSTIGSSSKAAISKFVDNTNLEQISDWFTKILVGVSLTQIKNIESMFNNIANGISAGMVGLQGAKPFVLVLIIFYLVCGFLHGYIWTRLQFYIELQNAREIEAPEPVK